MNVCKCYEDCIGGGLVVDYGGCIVFFHVVCVCTVFAFRSFTMCSFSLFVFFCIMSFTLIVYGEYGVMFTLNFTLNIMAVFAIVYTCCVCWLVDIVMRYVVQVVLVVHPMAAFHCCEFWNIWL